MRYISSMQQLAVVSVEEDAGVGQDSQTIRRYLEDLMADYYKPLSRQWANPAIRFSNLEKEWKESTPMLSSITEIVMHPSYQQIIGMGPTAIPLIFLSMRRELGHWFWALCAITGENPVSIEHRGKIQEMTDAWLDWGQKQLYLE
ncbi:MAG: hypothetical protein KAU17_05285 [Spirochaetales bacterium]|nr:hypothetical protein [Spirochaetales bacterium]